MDGRELGVNTVITNYFKSMATSQLQQGLFYASAIACAIVMFFANPAILESYREEWLFDHLEFSRTIYQSQRTYFSESILFPWLAHLIGANKHWLYYKLLASFLTILIVPVLAYWAWRYFEEKWRAWLMLFIFVLTYRYLWRTYYLGFPDPLTIVLLISAAFQREHVALFGFLVLASLSHFSITLVATCALLLLYATTPMYSRKEKISYIKWSVAALITGRLLLALWFYRFNYQHQTRLDWAMQYGWDAFVSRYQDDVLGFWLTPGQAFMLAYIIITVWSVGRGKLAYAMGVALSLALAYAALFLTIDGLRVFATVIVCSYVFALRLFIDQLSFGKYAGSQKSIDRTEGS